MSLQRELKKKRPFESLEQEAMLNIAPHQRPAVDPLCSAIPATRSDAIPVQHPAYPAGRRCPAAKS